VDSKCARGFLALIVLVAAGCGEERRGPDKAARPTPKSQAKKARPDAKKPDRAPKKTQQDTKPRPVNKKAEADLEAARALAAELRFDEAAKKLYPLIRDFEAAGRNSRAAEAAFWTGFCHEKLGQHGKAREFYDLVAREYSAAPACRQAVARRSRLVPE